MPKRVVIHFKNETVVCEIGVTPRCDRNGTCQKFTGWVRFEGPERGVGDFIGRSTKLVRMRKGYIEGERLTWEKGKITPGKNVARIILTQLLL